MAQPNEHSGGGEHVNNWENDADADGLAEEMNDSRADGHRVVQQEQNPTFSLYT
jgi:hypothetical protein